MIPHSHAMDSHLRAQDLTSTLVSATTPPQISAAISSLSSFLRHHHHSSTHTRPFFSLAFPTLILRLFAFDSNPATPGWIDLPDAKNELFELLSPNGVLFSAIAAVDANSLVRYAFPVERLPEWMRDALSVQDGGYRAILCDPCPLFKSRVKEDQLHLSVFEYYMFWFAYYPVCKGGGEEYSGGDVRKAWRFRLENWTSSLPGMSSGRRQMRQKKECGLYLKLLYEYLRAFVPKCDGGGFGPSCQLYRSSMLHYTDSFDETSTRGAEFVVNTFVQFWMVDNDFSPLPVSLCRSFGVNFTFRTGFSEAPSAAGLGEVLKLFVNYVNSGLVSPAPPEGGNILGERDLGIWKNASLSGGNFGVSWHLLIQRPLYRFILRSFLFCPMGTSVRNAAQVFSLWTSYMQPWKITAEDFVEFEESILPKGDSQGDESKQRIEISNSQCMYSPAWQDYVICNYLFYNSLVVHFLGFAHKFLHGNGEAVTQMVLKVLDILISSRELMDLLKNVDAAYHAKSRGLSSSSSNTYFKFLPSIGEQLQDWEDGLCENDADGSFLHENWNRDLKLFCDSEDGAQQLLNLLVVRAEPEFQEMAGENQVQNLQNLASIKAKMNALFGVPVRRSLSPTKCVSVQRQERDEIFTPKHPGVGKRAWVDIKYKGDWMRRPISDGEVAWLAKLLIHLSDLLNELLGLNRDGSIDVSTGPTYIEVPPAEVNGVSSLKDAIWMLLAFVGYWTALLFQVVLKFTRKRGWRINMRVFASKKVVTALLTFVVASTLKKAFGMCPQSRGARF